MSLRKKYKDKSINKIDKNKRNNTTKTDYKWTAFITLFTFFMSIALTLLLDNMLKGVGVLISVVLLLVVILIGILFDIIGVSVTSADQKLFHSMAANKIQEGKVAIDLIKNADKVSSFCNDVIGDMAGIISGALGASLLVKITTIYMNLNEIIIGTLITASIAGFTVGGKSLGKTLAINKYREIIFFISKMILKFREIFKIKK